MTIWVSSDLHLFHDNMWKEFRITCPECDGTGIRDTLPINDGYEDIPCHDCGGDGKIKARPFNSNQEMHDCMLDAHNARIKSQDHWYNLGDLCVFRNNWGGKVVSELVAKFNGHKRLLLGNHDQLPFKWYGEMFQKVKGYHRIDNLIFSHIPLERSSIPRGFVNVHGHIHTLKSPPGPYINVCVEPLNYAPISVDELKEKATALLKTLNVLGEPTDGKDSTLQT